MRTHLSITKIVRLWVIESQALFSVKPKETKSLPINYLTSAEKPYFIVEKI